MPLARGSRYPAVLTAPAAGGLAAQEAAYKAKVLEKNPHFVHWGEEESGSVMVNAINPSLNGTYYGGVTTGVGNNPFGGVCPRWDGSGTAYALVNGTVVGQYNVNGPMTMFTWWKFGDASYWTDGTSRYFMGWYKSTSNSCQVCRHGGGSKWFRASCVILSDWDELYYKTYAGSADTEWHSIAFTLDAAADQLRLFFDGVEVPDSPKTSIGFNNTGFYEIDWGKRRAADAGSTMNGEMWAFMGWTSVLSDENILDLATLS